MAEEGNVLIDGAALTAAGMDGSEMDTTALNLYNALYLKKHGVYTTTTISHNTQINDLSAALSGSYNMSEIDNTNTNISVFDWKDMGFNYLCPPVSTIYDNFDGVSLNGTLWATNGANTTTSEGSGYATIEIHNGSGTATGDITSKTNWGTGGSNVTYFRCPIRRNLMTGTSVTFSLQLSSVTGAGGTQKTLYTETLTTATTYDVFDVWISGNTAYVYKSGVSQGTVDITGYTATWYLRFYGATLQTNGDIYIAPYDCGYGLGATSTVYLAATNMYGSKNIGTVALIGQTYKLFTGMSGTSIEPRFSCDNGSNYVAKTGDVVALPDSSTDTYPYLFVFGRTDYRGKGEFIFTNDNTGANFGYELLAYYAYQMRQ